VPALSREKRHYEWCSHLLNLPLVESPAALERNALFPGPPTPGYGDCAPTAQSPLHFKQTLIASSGTVPGIPRSKPLSTNLVPNGEFRDRRSQISNLRSHISGLGTLLSIFKSHLSYLLSRTARTLNPKKWSSLASSEAYNLRIRPAPIGTDVARIYFVDNASLRSSAVGIVRRRSGRKNRDGCRLRAVMEG
jgi:hypothetical protein